MSTHHLSCTLGTRSHLAWRGTPPKTLFVDIYGGSLRREGVKNGLAVPHGEGFRSQSRSWLDVDICCSSGSWNAPCGLLYGVLFVCIFVGVFSPSLFSLVSLCVVNTLPATVPRERAGMFPIGV